MFSKSAVSRRIDWIRGKVASSTQVDIESGPTHSSNKHSGIINFDPHTKNLRPNRHPNNRPSFPHCKPEVSPEVSPEDDGLSNGVPMKNSDINKKKEDSNLDMPSLDSNGIDNNIIVKDGDTKENDDSREHEAISATVIKNDLHKESSLGKFVLSTYQLKAYLEHMYYVGVSPFQTERLGECASQTWTWWTVHLLQKVLFSIVTFMSAWHSISNAKYCYISFMSGIGLHNFVDFGFHFVSFLTKGQHVYTMIFRRKTVENMLNSMGMYEQKYNNRSSNLGSSLLATALGICTVLIVALRFLSAAIFEWSLKGVILENSVEFSENVLIWNHENLTYKEDQMYQKYGEKITPTTVALGTSTFVADISSRIQMDSIRNLLLLSAWTLYSIVNDFMKQIDKTMNNVTSNDANTRKALQADRESCWPMYLEVKEVVADSNDVNDGMLKILHVDNLLLYAHFVTICITKSDTSAANIIYYLWTIAKSELTYYIAGMIAGFNDRLRRWIRNWGRHTGKIKVGDENLDVNIILDELTSEPLGFGKGNFLIKPTFHFKFLGLVGSLALFLADEKKKDE